MKKRKSAQWSRLDNAAKIFPPTSSKTDPKVFRFACELNETVDSNVLQQALDRTVEAFPHFRAILRRGLFWYYLEGSPLKAEVHEESEPPCRPLYDPVSNSLLFTVSFYHCRINLEVYHALTDGTGALQFLRMLVYHYLILKHADAFGNSPPAMDYDASLNQRNDDSFRKYYNDDAAKKREHAPVAYQLSGTRLSEHRIRVIEGELSASALLEKARAKGATITAFLAAALICVIHEETPVSDQKKSIVVSIPVNLRKYFYSESARNFFGVIKVSYTFEQENSTFDDVLASVSDSLAQELTADRLSQRMNALSALEHNALARIIPLFLKDISLKIANHFIRKEETFSLSNVGKVSMPEPLKPYIRLFDMFNSADRLKLCMCSYENHMVLSLTSPFISTDIQKRFFRMLSALDIDVVIHSNQVDDE
ncbi:hypothetical protein V6615_06660 [Oscillospiraceae bacterium PP1C4]